MSKMIQCDECEKMMYTDSREDKGAFVSMTADILRNCPEYGLADGYCIMSIRRLSDA